MPHLVSLHRLLYLTLVALVLPLALSPRPAAAQAEPAAASANGIHTDDPDISPVHGFNLSVSDFGQHTSSTGWANIVTPTVSWRFNEHLLLDASLPWYTNVNGFVPVTTKGVKTYPLRSGTNLLGDLTAAAHLEASRNNLTGVLNGLVAFPTGNTRYGLSANTTTYNVTTHLDYNLGRFTPDIEFGIGDNSSLANPSAHKAYVAVGTIANFQAGGSVDLPLNLSFDAEAYESLPLGNQNVYGTVTHKNKKGKTTTTQVLEGMGAVEDNGFDTELDLPVGEHFLLSSTYERSLVQALDTVSFGITWTLRTPHAE